MKRNLTCIVCPRGCSLTVELDGTKAQVTGHSCPKGEEYGTAECLCPKRGVTSVIRVVNREDTMVSVKTSQAVKKEDVMSVMEILKTISVEAPVKIGDVLLTNVCGADIVATKSVP